MSNYSLQLSSQDDVRPVILHIAALAAPIGLGGLGTSLRLPVPLFYCGLLQLIEVRGPAMWGCKVRVCVGWCLKGRGPTIRLAQTGESGFRKSISMPDVQSIWQQLSSLLAFTRTLAFWSASTHRLDNSSPSRSLSLKPYPIKLGQILLPTV